MSSIFTREKMKQKELSFWFNKSGLENFYKCSAPTEIIHPIVPTAEHPAVKQHPAGATAFLIAGQL